MDQFQLAPSRRSAFMGSWKHDLSGSSSCAQRPNTMAPSAIRAFVAKGCRFSGASIPDSRTQIFWWDSGGPQRAVNVSPSATHTTMLSRLPWQRGSNENGNGNGMVRDFLTKGMDLSCVSHELLTATEHALRILNFHSPHEVFVQPTANHIAGVALQV